MPKISVPRSASQSSDVGPKNRELSFGPLRAEAKDEGEPLTPKSRALSWWLQARKAQGWCLPLPQLPGEAAKPCANSGQREEAAAAHDDSQAIPRMSFASFCH